MMHIIRRADGGVSILQMLDDADFAEEFDKWKAVADPAWLPAAITIVDDDEVPADRTFRNAWTHDGKTFGVDISKAQEVVKQRLREARAPKLAALDTEFLRAAEAQDAAKLTEIAEKKQALRDITAHASITNAKTVKGLASALTKLKQSLEA